MVTYRFHTRYEPVLVVVVFWRTGAEWLLSALLVSALHSSCTYVRARSITVLPGECVSKIQAARDTSVSTVLARGCATVLT